MIETMLIALSVVASALGLVSLGAVLGSIATYLITSRRP